MDEDLAFRGRMERKFPHIDDEGVQREVIDILVAGGVVALPTDTLHGFSAVMHYTDGLRRIAAMKGATGRKQFILLASSIEMVDRYVSSFGCTTRERLDRIWPAPLTAVLPAGSECPVWYGDTVAFRVPDLPPLRVLLERLGRPVVSSSVNRSNEAPLADPLRIYERFGKTVDAIIAGPPARTNLCSTIVDFTGHRPQVLRQGDYQWEDSG